jgi:hypothetical protein
LVHSHYAAMSVMLTPHDNNGIPGAFSADTSTIGRLVNTLVSVVACNMAMLSIPIRAVDTKRWRRLVQTAVWDCIDRPSGVAFKLDNMLSHPVLGH